MNTRKLYEEDSTLRRFTARVLDCREEKEGWAVILDGTAFFPQGGGQGWDTGTLGGYRVLEVTEENGAIRHLCDGPMEPGSQVEGLVDDDRRRDLTQQHSGEHIVSGIIAGRYGFHNVGFHMGADTVTVDFDGVVPQEALEEIQWEANRAVLRDIPLHIWYPTAQELERIPYRSKKKLEGPVRLVEIPGVDLCACCGTHVVRTGQIGPILFLSWMRFRQGVRMELVCGERALRYLFSAADQNRKVAQMLSAKPLESYAGAKRLQEDLDQMKYRCAGLEDRINRQTAEELRGRGNVLLVREDLSPEGLRRLACAVMETCGGLCAAVSASGGGCRYAVASQTQDVRPFVKKLNEALGGRGGGKPELAQGSVQADIEAVRAFWEKNQ